MGADVPTVLPGDMQAMRVPMDFLGINYYTRVKASAGAPYDVKSGGLEVTDMGWEVYPQGITNLLLRLHRDYAAKGLPPLIITENGAAFADTMSADGQVHDAPRVRYLQDHFAAVHEAMRQGVHVDGYFVWSLLDNFEWASGYEKRFGIVHVDYATQQRTLKQSALWYRDFLRCQPS